MGNHFEGKAVIVTGGGRGIGRQVALAFATEGGSVVVVDPGVARDGTGGEATPAMEVVNEIKAKGGNAVPCYESVANFESAERIIQTCLDSFGRLDVLFNGAGVLREKMIYNMSEEEWDTVISVHLKGSFNMARHACVVMRQQQSGRIVNVTSDAWRGQVGQVNYSAAKAGIVGLTRSIAREMGRFGVTCNAICPLASTRMTMTDEFKSSLKRRLESGGITQQRYNELVNMPGPEYIAPAVLFLASEGAANLNGQVVGIFGSQISLYAEPVQTKVLAKNEGPWELEELMNLVPTTLLVGYVNPAPKTA